MTQAQPPRTQSLEEWKAYDLDHYAQELVIKNRDKKDVLIESYKMRMAVAYGLERFWGEQFRLERDKKDEDKAQYWKDVWETLAVKILDPAGIELPNDSIKSNERDKDEREAEERENIKKMANKIWKMEPENREVALMVLTQFCDSLVWWTQRYKKKSSENKSGN